MLSRKYKISADKFPRITRGKVFQNEVIRMVFFYDKTLLVPKYAVIVPVKIAKTAVVRNKIRRQLYDILEKYIQISPIAYISIYPKKITSTYQDFEKSIQDLICSKK
jgi:ribonuclease P protein component